jgi:hypothetical protein
MMCDNGAVVGANGCGATIATHVDCNLLQVRRYWHAIVDVWEVAGK